MALLSCSSFVYMSQAKYAAYDLSGECLRMPIAASSSRKGERTRFLGKRGTALKWEVIQLSD